MGIIKKLGSKLPESIKPFASKAYFGLTDRGSVAFDGMPIPPHHMINVGPGDFEKIGNDNLRLLIDLADLTPDSRVLDVGCGIGRVATPLMRYLKSGTYEGFDTALDDIQWCQQNLTPRNQNFQFKHASIYNGVYNPKGTVKSTEYAFPYKDADFDIVFLTSVFTHMFTADMTHYMQEISRVVKHGGNVLATWFLLNEDTHQLIKSGVAKEPFTTKKPDGSFIAFPHREETAIAYEDTFVKSVYQQNRLRIIEPIHYGTWRKGKHSPSYQDVIVATRE